MSIYYRAYVVDHGGVTATNATYLTARASTAATTLDSISYTIENSTGYSCSQALLTFDTSAIPAGSGTGAFQFFATSVTNTNADTVQIREVSSIANKIAGASLGALTLHSNPATFPSANSSYSAAISSVASLPRSATFRVVVHTTREESGTVPTGLNKFTIRSTSSPDRPFIQVVFGTPWSFIGVSSIGTPVTATPIILTEPAGVADGDLLIACIASRTTATTAITGTGWTAVGSQNNNNTLTTGSAIASGTMLYRIRSGTPTLSFTLPATVSVAMGQIVAYRGSAQTTPLDASTAVTAAAGLTPSVTGLTTTQDDDLIVAMCAGGQEAAWSAFNNVTTPIGASGATDTTTAPSTTAWIERADNVTTSGADTSLGVFDAIMTGTGATGNLTVTASVSAGHVVIAGAFKIAPTPTADAWNVSDKSANLTLSAADKTATASSATNGGVRSTTTQTNGAAGKYYAEFLIGTTAPSRVGITPTSNTLIGALSNFWVATSDGTISVNGSTGILIGALASTDVCCVAWDAGAERVWFRKNGGNWNNNASHDPATGIGGFDASFAASTAHALWAQGTVSGAVTTVRTELAEYTQTIPSGFTSWMGETPAGGGISVPVTGVSATGSVGSVTVATVASVSVPVTGVQATGAVDQVTAIGRTPVSVGVTGVQATGAVDSVTIIGKANVALTGVQATGAAGSVTVAAATGVSVPATGVQATGSVGTVTVSAVTRVDVSTPVTGVAATGSVGTATATGKASTTITGVQATGAVGTVTVTAGVGVSVPVTGVQATGAVGTATATGKADAAVAGVAATGSVGSVTVTAGTGVTIPVTGVAASGSVDAVTVVGKANVPLTGVAATGAIGGVSVVAGGSISTTVTGVQATGSVGSVTVAVVQGATVPVTGVQAVASVGAVTVTAAELAGLVSVWNGSAWVDKPAKVWTGSAWMQKPVKHWTGSAWV